MDKIGILPNIYRDINLEYTNSLIKWLSKYPNKKLYLKKDFKTNIYSDNSNIIFCDNNELICEQSDFVIVLGGDGTILDKAPHCAKYGTPLLGINLGGIGYLTDAEKDDGFNAIENIFNGKYNIQKRMMIQTKLKNHSYFALNDICTIKNIRARLIPLEIFVNEQYIDTYRGDGIIISTPTGSTAYNLSAGGPIIKPDLDVMAITPICAHKIFARPLIISSEDVVKINMGENEALISIDGKNVGLSTKSIYVSKAPNPVNIIKTCSLGFYDILRRKL